MIVRFPTSAFDRSLDRSIDRAFEQLTSTFFDTRRSHTPQIDGAWKGDEYVITVDLPGVPADAVTVEVTGDILSLEARTDDTQWQRTLRLAGRLDPEQVHAHHVDGRLTVRIGTVADPEARRVVITTTPPPVAIDAEASTTSQSSATNSAG